MTGLHYSPVTKPHGSAASFSEANLLIKPIYRHWVVVKESTVLIAGTKQGEYAAKDPNSPDRFQRRVFKGKFWGEGCRLQGQLMEFQWLVVR